MGDDLDLDAIEARAAAATQGLWETRPERDAWRVVHRLEWKGATGFIYFDCRFGWSDAEFIAHARQDVPALCAALREFRAALARAEAERDEWEDTCGALYAALKEQGDETSGAN